MSKRSGVPPSGAGRDTGLAGMVPIRRLGMFIEWVFVAGALFMTQDGQDTQAARPGILGAYFRIGAAILVGACLVLGIYFFVTRDNPRDPAAATAGGLCACPNCGLTLHRPARMDCEEVNCPNCGHSMEGAAVLAAMEPGRRMTTVPRMQNQRQSTILLPPMGGSGICICPACGRRVTRQAGASCSQLRCPSCGTTMTNAIFIGSAPTFQRPLEPREALPAGMNAAPCPQTAASAAPCPQQTGGCINYSNTIAGVLAKNCLRCHGGPIRELTTYRRVKAYVDNGLLMMMVQPGGPMSRFLSADDAHRIISWIRAGAPP